MKFTAFDGKVFCDEIEMYDYESSRTNTKKINLFLQNFYEHYVSDEIVFQRIIEKECNLSYMKFIKVNSFPCKILTFSDDAQETFHAIPYDTAKQYIVEYLGTAI